MGSVGRLLLLCGALATGGVAALAASAQRSSGAPLHGDAARGKEIAARWCVSCHRADGGTLTDQAPSFAALAASGRSEAAIRGFLVQPHPPMPPLSLANQEIEDIIAHLRTLKPTR
jgi:mono/diheme cytochrome c family protein